MNVYYNATTNEIYIDKGSKTTTVKLPEGTSDIEVAYVLQCQTTQAIIEQLLKIKGDM